MIETKIIKHPWFKPVIAVIIFISLIILIGRIVIFSRPELLQSYLEFLNRNSRRDQSVAVYSKTQFAQEYLAIKADAYRSDDFTELFQEHFNNPPAQENNFFKVYQVTDKTNPCRVDIFGVSKKNDLIYVSFRDICLKNDEDHK